MLWNRRWTGRSARRRLAELARGKRSAAISVCDITRPAPNRLTLPPVLRRLEQAGIPRDGITILIATGLHRAATDSEIREICGEEIAAAYRVVNHDARDLSSHRHVGSTKSGTPVYVDERFAAADLHLTLGFIEPHLMLGYSGGRKLIAPGLAAQETIKVLHSPKFMRDPRGVEGSIDDNPLHRELLEIARLVRHDFIVDVALARDRSIAGVFAGDPELAHANGVDFVSRVLLETLDEPVDAAITSSAGYPLDLTYYQCIKGVTAASAHRAAGTGRFCWSRPARKAPARRNSPACCARGNPTPTFWNAFRALRSRSISGSWRNSPWSPRSSASSGMCPDFPPSITRDCGDGRTKR